MSETERTTVRVEDLAYSNMLTLNALVELLDEKGILPKAEILGRIKKLGEEARPTPGKDSVKPIRSWPELPAVK